MEREITRAVKPLAGQLGQMAQSNGLVAEVLLAPHLQRHLGRRAGQGALLVDAKSVVRAVLQGLQLTL